MRTAIAWFHKGSLLACAACGSVATSMPDAAPGADEKGRCVLDSSHGALSAIPYAGAPIQGSICPVGDTDWYAVEVPPGMSLVDLGVGYPASLTRVELAVQLYSADGATPFEGAGLLDGTNDGKSELATTFRVPQPGRTLLSVRDVGDDERDSANTYVLELGLAADPDPHEPNDTIATASQVDGRPAWFAYQGDVDVYHVSVPSGSRLVQIQLDAPAAARAQVHYTLADADGSMLAEGMAIPGTPLTAIRAVGGPGDYFLRLRPEPDRPPDRRTEAGYTLAVMPLVEEDVQDQATRNDQGATATCLGGGATTCGMPYDDVTVTYPEKIGQIGSQGDRDFFRFDVTSGLAAVVEISVDTAAGPGPLRLAVDLLKPQAGSPCTLDNECAAINSPCNDDRDCELSHSCLPAAEYAFCEPGVACRLCAGASVCLPMGAPGGPTVCAVPQYLAWVREGESSIMTAQPLFETGPYYVVVHDLQDDAFDHGRDYALKVRVVPEPDAYDRTVATRNNFYDPWPTSADPPGRHASRAVDINEQMASGAWLTGWLSYEADQDWFWFNHPCPGMDCGLVFEWTQPGPSPVAVVMMMLRDDYGLHESWYYAGDPTALTAPLTAAFGDGGCDECSFAYNAHGDRYYLQIRDYEADHWDFANGGQYRFRMLPVTPGCPASCSNHPSGQCGYFCPEAK